jgi:RNA polymerase sigma-70 factor (ECF subfamily)
MTDLDMMLARCRRGDGDAWEALVRRYQGRIFGFALHYLRDHAEAEDASQEIFIKMYQHLDGVRDGGAFLPWMLRLTRNCCIDRIRGRRARGFEIDAAGSGLGPERASTEASPEETLLETGRRRLVHRALARLTAVNREIVFLKDIEELKLCDISARLGVPLGTVKSRSNRAHVELTKAVRSLEAAAEVVP